MWRRTRRNLTPELLLYGIPVAADSVFLVMRVFCKFHGIEYVGDCVTTLSYASELINRFCKVDFLKPRRPAVPYSNEHQWMISFYSNRNVGRRGQVDKKKEDEIVGILCKLFGLREAPPKLWFWADVEEPDDW